MKILEIPEESLLMETHYGVWGSGDLEFWNFEWKSLLMEILHTSPDQRSLENNWRIEYRGPNIFDLRKSCLAENRRIFQPEPSLLASLQRLDQKHPPLIVFQTN